MSCSRACDFFMATDNQWYLYLGVNEHDEDHDDCWPIGPFESLEEAEQILANAPISNPGGSVVLESILPVPDKVHLN